jgi:hypothetical protein
MNHNDLFSAGEQKVGLAGFLQNLKPHVDRFVNTNESIAIGSGMLNVESIDPGSEVAAQLRTSAQAMLQHVNVACEAFLVGAIDPVTQKPMASHTPIQKRAAAMALMMGHNLKGAIAAPTRPSLNLEGILVHQPADNTAYVRRASLESYDEQATGSQVMNSVGFNLEASRQNTLAETFFPTVVIPPSEAGLMVEANLPLLMDDAKRSIAGAATNFNRVNVIRAQTYPSLLQNDATDVVPVVRDESADKFVDPAILAPFVRKLSDGTSVTTNALKAGVKIDDLIGLAHTDAMLAKGMPDQTDSIDPGVLIDNLYIQIGSGATKEMLKFPVKGLGGSAYYQAPQGDWRDLVASFENSSMKVDNTTKLARGGDSTLLTTLVSGGYTVRLSVSVSAKLNLQFGGGSLSGLAVEVMSVSKAGIAVGTDSGAGKDIADLFAGATVAGYDLAAKRSNLNKRLRGQTIDNNVKKEFYPLNLLAPITAVSPHGAGDVNDGRNLAILLFTCKVRSSISAIRTIRDHAALLKSQQSEYHIPGETIETIGMARHFLDPYYAYDRYVAPDVVDTIKSSERNADIRASLVTMIQDHVFKMWQLSSYGPASASQNGGKETIPTVLIACDPRIEQYLNIQGDLRLLGDKFPVKVVSDTNIELRGKIYISFGNMDTAAAGVVNIFHYGNTMYRPEMTMMIPVSRDGQTSRELTVSPAFRQIVHLPLMIEMDVEGIEDVVNKKVPIVIKELP